MKKSIYGILSLITLIASTANATQKIICEGTTYRDQYSDVLTLEFNPLNPTLQNFSFSISSTSGPISLQAQSSEFKSADLVMEGFDLYRFCGYQRGKSNHKAWFCLHLPSSFVGAKFSNKKLNVQINDNSRHPLTCRSSINQSL